MASRNNNKGKQQQHCTAEHYHNQGKNGNEVLSVRSSGDAVSSSRFSRSSRDGRYTSSSSEDDHRTPTKQHERVNDDCCDNAVKSSSSQRRSTRRLQVQRSQSIGEYPLSSNTFDGAFDSDDGQPMTGADGESAEQCSVPSVAKPLRLVFCASDDAYVVFLKTHRCFELMPTSGRVLVLDSALSVKKAFYALVFNNTRAAIISTTDKNGTPQFTGVLSTSDFIELLTLYYRSKNERVRELEELTIRAWKNQLNSNAAPRSIRALPGIAGGGATRHLVHIPPDMSLFDTVKLLEKERVHRVPIINPQTKDFLYFVTLKRILRFLFLAIYHIPRPNFIDKSIEELGLGTYSVRKGTHNPSSLAAQSARNYKKVYTITTRTPVIEALRLLVRTGVSALPIVDTTGRLRDLFSRFDVIHLAAYGSYSDLDRSVEEALQVRRRRIEAVLCCHPEESLITVMVRMVTGQVHRLVIVDKSRRVIGILSLSDLMSFLTQVWQG